MNISDRGTHKSLEMALEYAFSTAPKEQGREACYKYIKAEVMEFINASFSIAVLEAEDKAVRNALFAVLNRIETGLEDENVKVGV